MIIMGERITKFRIFLPVWEKRFVCIMQSLHSKNNTFYPMLDV